MTAFLVGFLIGYIFGVVRLSDHWREKYPDLHKEWNSRISNEMDTKVQSMKEGRRKNDG